MIPTGFQLRGGNRRFATRRLPSQSEKRDPSQYYLNSNYTPPYKGLALAIFELLK